MAPGAEPRWTWRDLLMLGGGFLLLSLALCWRTLSTSYVYDDWLVLDELFSSGTLQALVHHFDPRAVLTYRPLAWVYFAAVAHFSGLNPLAFHLLALSIHAMNGVLIGWIGARVSGQRPVGILAGALFISLLSLDVDCFLWLVGFYDLGAMGFALLSMVLLMRSWRKSSAVLMGCALLTKEAVAFLPIVLVLAALLFRKRFRELGYHFAVTTAYAIAKICGASPFHIARGNAHAMDASWMVFTARLTEYSGWLAGALLPLAAPGFIMPGAILLLIAAGFWLTTRNAGPRLMNHRRLLFLAGWFLLTLMPVLLLKNQSARYYAVHSAVPLVIALSAVAYEIVSPIGRKGHVILVAVAAVVAISNVVFVGEMFEKGIDQLIVNDGYFHLVKRAAVVRAVYDGLNAQYPELPHGSIVVVDGVPLDAVGGSRAIRMWYKDTTLQMTTSMSLRLEDSSFAAFTDCSKVVNLRLGLQESSQEK
jgi:hypothetical protein